MENTVFLILISISIFFGIFSFVGVILLIKNMKTVSKLLTYQHGLLAKIQNMLKNNSSINETTEKSEIIYQDLLQNLIPIMAAINVMPRSTSEHPLWRALGGIMDEYAKNPFALEKLRRAIKNNAEVARNIENYIARADSLLLHLTKTEPDGMLTATFTNGLLGQSLTFFAQARTLANQQDNE